MNEYRLKKYEGSIYLTGFMATGKSTIGRLVARELERSFADLDNVITTKEKKSIKRIFAEKGEAYFREKEWEYLLELTREFKGVVSLGGGALHNQRVIDHLKLHGIIVFIDTPMDIIIERVLRNTNRPIVLNEKGEIKSKETLYKELKSLYSSRIGLYQQAQITLESIGSESIEGQALQLIDKLKRYV